MEALTTLLSAEVWVGHEGWRCVLGGLEIWRKGCERFVLALRAGV